MKRADKADRPLGTTNRKQRTETMQAVRGELEDLRAIRIEAEAYCDGGFRADLVTALDVYTDNQGES